jgi:membrane protease YdiL (CAAX protease family)
MGAKEAMTLRYFGWMMLAGLVLGIVSIVTGGTHNPYGFWVMTIGGACMGVVFAYLWRRDHPTK